MTTTTDQIMQADQKERDKRIFKHQMEYFLNQWAPADPYERSQFESHLHSLIRQIYTNAQQPLLDQLTKVMMAMPLTPMILKGKEE